jgi:hypothetical protein
VNRGDGHVACLVHANLDACEAHLLAMASGVTTQEVLQFSRRWTDQDWAAASARLQQRGWLDAQGGLTPTGAAAKRHLEEHTDTLAAPSFAVLSEAQQAQLIELVQSLGRQIVHAGGVPFPNPMGLPDTPYGDLK